MPAAAYRAPGWLANPHLHTIYGSLLVASPRVAYRRERWDTPDGDFVDVDHVDAPPDAPRVVLFHGLEGSSDSPYARMLMHRVAQRGWRGAVVNFRGCSGEPNRLPRAYHSGDWQEVDWILAKLASASQGAPLFAAGVSLGGNALLKWLGERGAAARGIVARAAAVSAPLDLMAAGDALGRGFSLLYAKHFLGTLKARAEAPIAGSIPWLLLATKGTGTAGSFSKVTSIQRVNTSGGMPPSSPCTADLLGRKARVDYVATYRFFVAN